MASLFDGFKSRNTVFTFIDPLTKAETAFAIDVTKSLSTSLKATVTEFPVEGQQNINDHFQPSPLEISIECLVSESPSQQVLTIGKTLIAGAIGTQFRGLSSTFASAAASAAISGAAALFGEKGGVATYNKLLANRGPNDVDYPKKAMQGLIRVFEQGIPFTIRSYFDVKVYTNMVMTSLSFPQAALTGDSLQFTMSAKKITTVDVFDTTPSETQMKDPAGSSAAKSANKGKISIQGPVPLESQLSKGAGFLADLFTFGG